MHTYIKVCVAILGFHSVKCISEYAYFTQCTGFCRSMFAQESPMCRGLHKLADSSTTNVLSIVGTYGAKFLSLDYML